MCSLRQLFSAAVTAGFLCGISAADTISVPGDYSTIQAAIDAAAFKGDEIVVEPGTYLEAINFLGKAVHLRSADGAATTTIDATGLGTSVVTCTSGETPASVLEGFTITGGDAVQGGGMNNVFSSPTVIDCIFEANSALQGGAIRNSSAHPQILSSIFRNNTATQNGGGISNTNSNPVITSCQFLHNTADQEGGALYNVGNSVATVADCRFEGNTAVLGGAVYGVLSPAAMTDNVFCQNSPENVVGDWDDLGGNEMPVYCEVIHVPADFATIQAAIDSVTSAAEIIVAPGTYPEAIDLLGKVIYLRRETAEGPPVPAIIDATGLDASVVTCINGESSDTIIEGFTLTGGTGTGLTEGGPVEHFGGGVLIMNSNPTIDACHITGNSALHGGGVYIESGNPLISATIIETNDAVGASALGGGMLLVDASPTLNAVVVINNTAENDGGGIFADNDSLAVITDSIVCDNAPNNLVGSVDDQGGNTICPDGPLGDLNNDGVVDVADLLILMGAWGACPKLPADCPADLNDDSTVDVADMLVLLGNWG